MTEYQGTIIEFDGKYVFIDVNGTKTRYEYQPYVEQFLKVGECKFDLDESKKVRFVTFNLKKDDKQSNKTEGPSHFEEDMVSFEELLKNAHEKGEDFSITTECLKLDFEKKEALFKAVITVRRNDQEVAFEAHGDATQENIKGAVIKPHYVRMAETRAICRALRWYTNNAACSEEEKD